MRVETKYRVVISELCMCVVTLLSVPLLVPTLFGKRDISDSKDQNIPKEGIININGLFVITITPLYNGHIVRPPNVELCG